MTNKNRGKDNPNYKDGRTLKKYYCMDCSKELSNYTAKRCIFCSNKERSNRKVNIEKIKGNQYAKGYKWTDKQKINLNREGENAPCYRHGRYIVNYCSDCDVEIGPTSKRCQSCNNSLLLKKSWENPEFRKLKIKQGKQQWIDGKMDGAFKSPTKPEKEIMLILDKLKIDYVFQFRPKGYYRIYDFYIKNSNLLIEYDSEYWHSRADSKERDAEKTKYAKDNGYRLLRIKENGKSNNFKSLIKREIDYGR